MHAPTRTPFVLLVATALLASTSSADARSQWRKDVPCLASGDAPVLRKLPEPVATNRSGCVAASCVDLPEGEQLCECSREDGDVGLTLHVRGRAVNQWSGDVSGPIGPGHFAVLVGDLDADAKDEIIAVNLRAVSNGMGVQTYGAAILDGRDRRRPPVRFEVQEFDDHDSFGFSASQQTCQILVTSWENGRDSRRGWGLYLVGQWYRYREGRLVPDATRPVLSRRYLNSLQRERDANMSGPFLWLQHTSTVESPTSLPSFLGLRLVKTESGQLLHANEAGLEVRLAGESPRLLEASRTPWFSGTPDRPDLESVYSLLADEASHRLYPHAYTPSDPERDFADKPLTVRTYELFHGGRVKVISLGTSGGGRGH